MIKINDLTIKYGKKKIIDNLNLEIGENKFIMIVGKNGAGKSSLINALNNTIKYEGNIFLDGLNIKDYHFKDKAKRISLLPQHLPKVHIKVFDLISFGRNPYLKTGKNLTNEDKVFVENVIKRLNIESLKDMFLDELSGGQIQKVYLGMILSQNTNIIVLDEPVTFLDIENQYLFLKLLKDIQRIENKTVILVIHDLNLIYDFADDIIVLKEGTVIFSGTADECLENKILEKEFNVIKYSAENNVFFKSVCN